MAALWRVFACDYLLKPRCASVQTLADSVMGSIISTGSEQPLPEPSQVPVEEPVPAPRVPAAPAAEPVYSAEHAFQIGARVQARWAGKWFDAVVKAHRVQGVYEVDWLETPRSAIQ